MTTRKEEEIYTVTVFRDAATSVVTSEHWQRNGGYHRKDGPALVARDGASGAIVKEAWLRNGHLDREDGPAVVCRNPITGSITYSAWYRSGQKSSRPSRLARRLGPTQNKGQLLHLAQKSGAASETGRMILCRVPPKSFETNLHG